MLTKVHTRRDLLEASYGMLRAFAVSEFHAMFPGTVMYYYDHDAYAGRVFADLVRPQARGPHATVVLRAALELRFRAEHREILASDVLAGGDPLGSAWAGAAAPVRLEFAIAVYAQLLDLSPIPRGAIDAHLALPLLDEIVSGFLDLLRRPQPPTGRILRLMEPLASHLEECRRNGGDTSSAAPLLRLER